MFWLLYWQKISFLAWRSPCHHFHLWTRSEGPICVAKVEKSESVLRKIASSKTECSDGWHLRGNRLKGWNIPLFFFNTIYSGFLYFQQNTPTVLLSASLSVCTVPFLLLHSRWSFGLVGWDPQNRPSYRLPHFPVCSGLNWQLPDCQHIPEQGHDTCTHLLYSNCHGRGVIAAATFIKMLLDIWFTISVIVIIWRTNCWG